MPYQDGDLVMMPDGNRVLYREALVGNDEEREELTESEVEMIYELMEGSENNGIQRESN